MREIVLDTETTGLEPATGDRIVEIGAVELFNHMPTGKTYHQYINPERSMPKEAFDVHGLGDDFLRDKPTFRAIARTSSTFCASPCFPERGPSHAMKRREGLARRMASKTRSVEAGRLKAISSTAGTGGIMRSGSGLRVGEGFIRSPCGETRRGGCSVRHNQPG